MDIKLNTGDQMIRFDLNLDYIKQHQNMNKAGVSIALT